MAVLLAWVTAARCGCILQLRRQDITLGPNGKLAILFRRGKGALVRGPYTVHSCVPNSALGELQTLLADLQPSQRVFPPTTKGSELKDALRAVQGPNEPKLEQRSIRRGSLMALASTGLSEKELLHFSGHTNVTTLRRYLDWGRASKHLGDTMLRGATVAFG
jgi:integrase